MNISTQLGLRWLMLWGMLYLAGCSLFRGSNEEIISLSTRLDRNHAIHFNAAGVTHYQAGHLPLALVSFENALSHDATFGPAHNNMGRVFFDKSDLFQAAMSFEKAMQLMPGDPAPINNLGLVFESAGRTVEAIELYQTAHQINPTCAEYLGNLVPHAFAWESGTNRSANSYANCCSLIRGPIGSTGPTRCLPSISIRCWIVDQPAPTSPSSTPNRATTGTTTRCFPLLNHTMPRHPWNISMDLYHAPLSRALNSHPFSRYRLGREPSRSRFNHLRTPLPNPNRGSTAESTSPLCKVCRVLPD